MSICPCVAYDICHLLGHLFNVKSVTASCDVTRHDSAPVFVPSVCNVNFMQPSMHALLSNFDMSFLGYNFFPT